VPMFGDHLASKELVTSNQVYQLHLDSAKAIIKGVKASVQLCGQPVEVLGQLVG
ncbi:hypothetical protein U1Q18_003807, partial [Sarracenia purpurea var. burkii]